MWAEAGMCDVAVCALPAIRARISPPRYTDTPPPDRRAGLGTVRRNGDQQRKGLSHLGAYTFTYLPPWIHNRQQVGTCCYWRSAAAAAQSIRGAPSATNDGTLEQHKTLEWLGMGRAHNNNGPSPLPHGCTALAGTELARRSTSFSQAAAIKPLPPRTQGWM